MNKLNIKRNLLLGSTSSIWIASLGFLSVTLTSTASAQEYDETAESSDIIVSARKKDERSIDVPISITAIGSEELARRSIKDLRDLAASTPNLNIAPNSGPFGGTVALRGIGSGASGSFTVDQAVAVVIDGVTATHGSALRFSQFDLQQMEILNGPQSLYYGKNSTAGLISITSADPTPTLKAMVRVGYEFAGDQFLTEGYVSGPLTDKLSARLAFNITDSKGLFRNPLPAGTVHPTYGLLAAPQFPRVTNGSELSGRVTLKYEPTDRLTVRIKGAFTRMDSSPAGLEAQLYYCPRGVPQSRGAVAGVGDCVLNRTVVPASSPLTAVKSGINQLGDGTMYVHLNQLLTSMNVDYEIADNLALSSVTGFYKMTFKEVTNSSYASGPTVSSHSDMDKADFSQELRLASSFDGPLNFMIGAFGSKGHFDVFSPAALDVAATGNPPLSNINIWELKNEVISAFGQLTYKLGETIELSGGARFTSETKSGKLTASLTGPVALSRSSRRFSTVSPEATLSFKPNQDTNVYLSYRTGVKSGGFNVGAFVILPTTQDYTFDDEKAKGVEGGVKAKLFDRTLGLEANAYHYKYTDLQVASYNPLTATTRLQNAASAKVQGASVALNYSPPSVQGLTLSGSVNYNKARFTDYIGPCYTGQTPAQGCNQILNAAGTAYLQQNYAGKPLVKAPDWTGNVQVSYEGNIGSGLRFGISGGGNYSSSFYPMAEQPIQSLQKKYWLLDANIRIGSEDERWELALVGRNLTNTLRIQQGVGATLTPVLPANTGSLTLAGNMADLAGFTNRPRTVELRATLKY